MLVAVEVHETKESDLEDVIVYEGLDATDKWGMVDVTDVTDYDEWLTAKSEAQENL